jgi:hypothetical protein
VLVLGPLHYQHFPHQHSEKVDGFVCYARDAQRASPIVCGAWHHV